MPYSIVLARQTQDQLLAFKTNDRVRILDGINKSLAHEPLKETRHRKLLRPNPIAPWEFRIGDFRVFYEVVGSTVRVVAVVAVGVKRGSTLFISGRPVKL